MIRSVLASNFAVGILCSAWTAVLGFAVVPVYLRTLGIEAYGLIGFFASLQALSQLLDLGIAPTVNREVARHAAQGRIAAVQPLIGTLATVYWGVAAALGAALALSAPLIAGHWLRTRQLDAQTVEQAIMLLGVVIACRWPNAFYAGALVGAQRLRVSSLISAGTSTLGNLGAVLVLSHIAPTLQAFFAWQALVALAGTLVMRHAAWAALGPPVPRRTRFDLRTLESVWRFSAGMGAVGLLGLVFTQTDKLLLSRLLALPDYGHYVLAATVTSGLYVVVTPLFNAVYPRLSALVVQNDPSPLGDAYRAGTQWMTAILFPLAAFLAFFATDLVDVWTGDRAVAAATGPLIALLAAGSAVHGVMHMPHALQLAHGRVRLPLAVNAVLLLAFVPLVISLALAWGARGGALAWLVLQVLYATLNTWLTHRYFLHDLRARWAMVDVALPMLVSTAICGVLAAAAHAVDGTPGMRLAAGVLAVPLAAAGCVLVSGRLRLEVMRRLAPPSVRPAAGPLEARS